MSYKATEITAYLQNGEAATVEAAELAGKAIANAWNDREFELSATAGPLQQCVLDSPDMAPAAAVLDRLVRRFDVFVHDNPQLIKPCHATERRHPKVTETGATGPAPRGHCLLCESSYVSDRTPMGEAGYCMMCRPRVEVTCDRCSAVCPGAYDGDRKCATCRLVPLGVQQYEDKLAAAQAISELPITAEPVSRNGTDARTGHGEQHGNPGFGNPGLLDTSSPAAAEPAAPAGGAPRILVTGSRTWTDRRVIRDALATVWHPNGVLVSGACLRGADALCEQCWEHWGGQVERHPADWKRHGRPRAGFVRNGEMVAAGADVCLAFIRAGSSGASDCAGRARRAGIPTRIFTAE